MAVLVDAGVWIGFYNQKDEFHEKAVALMKELDSGQYGALFSTDYLFDESVTYCLVRYSIDKSLLIGEAIQNTTEMARVTDYMFNNAWDLFKRDKINAQKEKTLSFTDCTTIVLAKLLNIEHVATFDGRFRKYVSVLEI